MKGTVVNETEEDRLLPGVAATEYGTGTISNGEVSYRDVRMSITAGMMDLSLFIANANQLANVIRTPNGVELTALEQVTTGLIVFSIFMQIMVVLLLIWAPPSLNKASITNKAMTTCVFLILVINVMVACLNNELHYANCDRAVKPVPQYLAIGP